MFDLYEREYFYFSHHTESEDRGISYSTGPAKSGLNLNLNPSQPTAGSRMHVHLFP